MTIPLSIIVAVARNGVIGNDNKLLWRLRTDLQRFRKLTIGKPVIMGRKTFGSIGRPLPNRENIILTRDKSFSADGVHIVYSLDEALRLGEALAGTLGAEEIMVAGGTDIYSQTLPLAQRIYLTEVDLAPVGDAYFPVFDKGQFRIRKRISHPSGSDDEAAFSFVDLERKPAK